LGPLPKKIEDRGANELLLLLLFWTAALAGRSGVRMSGAGLTESFLRRSALPATNVLKNIFCAATGGARVALAFQPTFLAPSFDLQLGIGANSAFGGKKGTGGAGLPDFSWFKHAKTGKLYQMTTNYALRL
jgi:hypothetical protein